MYKYFMSTCGFKLAPYSIQYNMPKATIAQRVDSLVRPFEFFVVLIPNNHKKGECHVL